MGSIVLEPDMLQDAPVKGSERDFSKSCLFDPKTRKPDKTIDIGGHGSSLSLDAQGRVLQVSTYHPKHGMVMGNNFEQFDGTKFYDVSYVRSYRTRMLQSIHHDRAGFGLDFGIDGRPVYIRIVETNVASYHIELANNVDLSITVQVASDGSFAQYAKATNNSADCVVLPYALGLNVSLNRASYGQLTEGGPIPLPASRNVLESINPTTLRVYNPNLDAQLMTCFDVNDQSLDFQAVPGQQVSDAALHASLNGKISISPGATANFCASFRLLPNTARHDQIRLSPESSINVFRQNCQSRWKSDHLLTTYVLRRNVEYILGNCVVPISKSVAVVITDHVALPLGWNRDNYWQIQLLLETYDNISDLIQLPFVHSYKEKIMFAVKGHLNWVFTMAKRPHGFWERSYLTNGQPKDRSIFQLDQQCYPLLELCDYFEHFPEEVDFTRALVRTEVIGEILAVLETRKNADTQLWSTDETPGDDAVIYPHHFSSHVLLWRTFTRLHELHHRLGEPLSGRMQMLATMAAQVKERTMQAFTSTHPSCVGTLFAYLTDGHGNSTFYHDGNDMPTAFAQEWGFVSIPAETLTWQHTMQFGLSPANESGYCNIGPYSGLGSVHSPGAWTLGYFQELFYAASTNDVQAMQSTWKKIAAAMQWDGTFPEAVNPGTAKCTSKAWFSWPGAMIGALLIRMKKNGQEAVLLE